MNAKELAIQKGFHFVFDAIGQDDETSVYALRRGNTALVFIEDELPEIHRKVRGVGSRKHSGFCPFPNEVSCEVTKLSGLGHFYGGVSSSELLLMMMLGVWEAYNLP